MSELKLPPGPWWINPDHRPGMAWNREIVYGDGDKRICFMASDANEAAAHLIAAAPELYEALVECMREHGVQGRCRLIAETALAKARGEKC